MAKLLKSIAKEYNKVKDMIDIPALKNKRERLQDQRTTIQMKIDELTRLMANSQQITDSIEMLKQLSNVQMLDKDVKDKTVNLHEHLQTILNTSASDLTNEIQKMDECNKEIDELNKALTRARCH